MKRKIHKVVRLHHIDRTMESHVGWGGTRNSPHELRDRYRHIKRSVRVTPGRDVYRFAFTNDAFGQAFEDLHERELGWLARHRRERTATAA